LICATPCAATGGGPWGSSAPPLGKETASPGRRAARSAACSSIQMGCVASSSIQMATLPW
jgi:hypothetical protein